jgi:hypothetical protein
MEGFRTKMKKSLEVSFNDLSGQDLVVDCVYRGGGSGNSGDDPISKLLKVGNLGGFRFRGPIDSPAYAVLYTSTENPDWPDTLDFSTGAFVYYGDNRRPGQDLHDTKPKGNIFLRNIFTALDPNGTGRKSIPPLFIFSKASQGRDVIFRGLAVPGSTSASIGEDLVAIWRIKDGARFQNYRANFTILNTPRISRAWINELNQGITDSALAPTEWTEWQETGRISPLISTTIDTRTKVEQLPPDGRGLEIITNIHGYFNDYLKNPFLFERFAVDLWTMAESNVGEINLTRPWRDGGRDATGSYLLGTGDDRLKVEFALEAKCYNPNNSVGVREMSRLISRLRYRQFGVFVTTSYFNPQAYSEVREDGHPIVLVPAREIVNILNRHGLSIGRDVKAWLQARYIN